MSEQSGGPIDLFVIGAMKAATTGMCDWLDAQPQVVVSKPKEPSIFVSQDSTRDKLPGLDTLFPDASTGQVRVDGSTDYAKFPTIAGVPERVREHCPDARLVYLMRHPIDRAISQYRFEWLLGGDRIPFTRAMSETPQLIDNSRYAFQLRQWLDWFPPDRFLLIFTDAFNRDAAHQVTRVIQWLGLPDAGPVKAPEHERSNETTQLVRPSLGRRLIRESPLGQLVRPLVPNGLVSTYHRRMQERSRPEVTESDQQTMREVFDADLRELTSLTDGPGVTCATWAELATAWSPRLASA